jgi:ABC-2 type transport system ATP-binding protein
MDAIKTVGLTKRFKSKIAVDGLDLAVSQGELFALLGVNGAGKTTTIKMLTCLTRPTSGEGFIMGKSILTESREVKRLINVSPQETAVAPNLTAYENIRFISEIYGVTDAKKQAERLIEIFKMKEFSGTRAKNLSGGWMRRLSIAMALATEPKVLFLDEPTLGLDVLARRELWSVIEKLKGEMTVVLTTHYLEEAEALADRIAIMADGRLKALGTAEELKKLSGKETFEDAFIELAVGGDGK